MEAQKSEVVKRIVESGLIKDPQWLERLDEPVPLRVMLEAMLELLDKVNPPHRPYD
ncbi:hypothetical protein ACFOQM_20480 [Paenibacillus sp. GCM10012307]|uniref:Uncharacterized protein n=1 Tax=Paenibacillus roseus TaxID=2798579 RepID=A0A934JB62_9BACL|nr:hypothetical protein [Paenibacillus roseus]MBJ6363605.1 hypothetical protein [Paenibacillus roseus]